MPWDAEGLKKELFEETDHYSLVPSWYYNVMLLPALFFHILDKDIISHLAVLGIFGSSLRYRNQLGMKNTAVGIIWSSFWKVEWVDFSRNTVEVAVTLPKSLGSPVYMTPDSCLPLTMKVTMRVLPLATMMFLFLLWASTEQGKAWIAARWKWTPLVPGSQGLFGLEF